MSDGMTSALDTAQKYLGVTEFPGKDSNPRVERFFADAGFPGLTDDVPWCAAFVGAVLSECGMRPSGSLMARSYLKWGVDIPLRRAMPGDVVVLARGQAPSGHVAFLIGFDGDKVLLRGGNQSDSVCDQRYPVSSVIGIRRFDSAVAQSNRPTLQEGDRGAFVIDLQSQLQSLNYFAGKVDGAFGPLTRAAVLAFQGGNNLQTDGVVGPKTWAALKDAKPRPDRDVTVKDLREKGSRTIGGADAAGAGAAGLGSVAAISVVADQADKATAALSKAQGALGQAQALLMTFWPLLLVIALVGVAAWGVRKVHLARVEDARTGANLSR